MVAKCICVNDVSTTVGRWSRNSGEKLGRQGGGGLMCPAL